MYCSKRCRIVAATKASEGWPLLKIRLWAIPMTCCLAFGMPAIADDKSGFTFLNPTPDAGLRSFSTDRPPKANSPYTVDAGHFQYETDLVVYGYGNTAGLRTDQWTVLDPTLKLGLTNSIDAEVQLTPYESNATRGALGSTSASGVGDTVARLKVNLLGNDSGPVSLALLPYVKVPTAPQSLGNRALEGGLILPIAVTAPGGFTVVFMPEGDYLKNSPADGYHTVFDFLINVSHPLDKRWTLFSEIYTAQPLKTGYSRVFTLDEALTCLLRPSIQLDFGGNFALNSVTPRIQLYAGLSQRF